MAAATSSMPCPPPVPTASTATATSNTYTPEAAMRAAATTTVPPKHRPAKLGTPLSGTYPPLQSPRTHSPGYAIKREDSSASNSFQSYTPLTPPSAYLDFLKAMSPAITSPLSTGASATFSFHAGPQSAKTPSCGAWPSTSCSDKFPQPPASARPALSTFPSTASNGSSSSQSSVPKPTSAPETTAPKPSITPPQAPVGTPSSSTYPYPPPPPSRHSSSSSVMSASTSTHPQRPSRRPSVLIPDSPSTQSPGIRSPGSARDLQSPVPLSAAPYSATPFSAGGGGKTSPVTVRQVVTRTVIYSSSPKTATHPTETVKEITRRHTPPQQVLVGDAPRGKRRRVE